MPWSPSDAAHKTHAANTVTKRHKWAAIANAVLSKTGDEGKAIRIANSQVKR